MTDVFYPDGEIVEVGDDVWFLIDDPEWGEIEYEGRVHAIKPRAGTLKISYRDGTHTKAGNDTARRTIWLPVNRLELARRAA